MNSNFPIVGIGASAGGLEALELFFENMPEKSGMAFVVIQHLDPDHKGILPELLQRITPMKVFLAEDSQRVIPNSVFVIPSKKSMSILNGKLHLFDPVESRGQRLPIDIFFRSLADDRQENSIGIILSGMGSDGSLGLRSIKEKNGIVAVQEPATAKFDSMPAGAIENVVADIVSPVEELPEKLIAFLKHVPAAKTDIKLDNKNKNDLEKVIILLRDHCGHDFSFYKKNSLLRRIERRKGIHQIDKFSHYVRFLQENPKEIEILFRELLIGVTSFFRNKDVWKKLEEKVLPDLMNKLPDGYIVRAWVTACSTGEEAYSLAIIFKEVLQKLKKHKNLSLQIFATDLDSEAIEIARKGLFPSNIAVDVSPDRLNRFFTVDGEGYRVNSSLREMVVFASQNVIKDPPFTKLDIVTCRNMLIYMETNLQKKLMSLFNYSLNKGGLMVLGVAETHGNENRNFVDIDAKLKIFKKIGKAKATEFVDFPTAFSRKKQCATKKTQQIKVENSVQALAEQTLLQRFAPASVMVNEKGDILYITGKTGKYLEPVAGKANWNIHVMARPGLQTKLPGAFRRAKKSFDPVTLQNIKIGTNGGTQFVDVTVQRIEAPELSKCLILLVFNDVAVTIQNEKNSLKTNVRKSSGRQKELEIQLQRSNESRRSITEEMQTSQEELRSTNEELQSTNEELQSTNEELTTSKEEMQSLNEELQTVNAELQSKVTDFIQADNDMKNLLNSTEIATLFLDRELNIRRFTDSVVKIFKLRNSDAGRPFTDLVSNLQYPEFEDHTRMVLKNLSSIETAVTTTDNRWFNVRIMPYRTVDDRID
ncbi:MAG: chemotaxis protein CheB, partial [bacterium]